MEVLTNRLRITELTMEMAEAIHADSLDDATRRFLPDEVFETIKTAENFTVHKTYPYGTINKAVETANYFFIFENPKKAFIINKSELTEGSVPELEQFLSARFGKRFVDKRSVKI